ncbi:MAG: hypothetical protein QM784_20280 [Polyangiaceae bacterium]
MDPQGSLALEPTTTPGHGNFGTGLMTSYAYRLVRVEDEDGRQLAVPVRHQLSTDFLFNWGIGQRWALGLALPAVLYQRGNRVPDDDWRPPKTALGDPTLELKFNLLPKGPLGGIGLAAYGRTTLPLASEESGMGTGSVTAQFGLRGELDLVLASVRASAGYVFRRDQQVFWGNQFGNYAPWALGIVLKPQALGIDKQGHFQWFLEGHGAVAVTPEFATRHSSPVQMAAGTRYALGSDFSALAALEVPLNGGIGAPSLRAVLGLSWAPRFLDADRDGIADDADDCPEGMPEDRDGFEDDDGCPEDDNDGDAVADAEDRCPEAAEDLDGHLDEDGCPDTDNDADKILDAEDACPDEPGVVSRSKKYNGCPRKDTDADGIFDDVDRSSGARRRSGRSLRSGWLPRSRRRCRRHSRYRGRLPHPTRPATFDRRTEWLPRSRRGRGHLLWNPRRPIHARRSLRTRDAPCRHAPRSLSRSSRRLQRRQGRRRLRRRRSEEKEPRPRDPRDRGRPRAGQVRAATQMGDANIGCARTERRRSSTCSREGAARPSRMDRHGVGADQDRQQGER